MWEIRKLGVAYTLNGHTGLSGAYVYSHQSCIYSMHRYHHFAEAEPRRQQPALQRHGLHQYGCAVSCRTCSHAAAVRSWNVRPFAGGERLEKIFVGAAHNFEKNLLKVMWTHAAVMRRLTAMSGGVDPRRPAHWRGLKRPVRECQHASFLFDRGWAGWCTCGTMTHSSWCIGCPATRAPSTRSTSTPMSPLVRPSHASHDAI